MGMSVIGLISANNYCCNFIIFTPQCCITPSFVHFHLTSQKTPLCPIVPFDLTNIYWTLTHNIM